MEVRMCDSTLHVVNPVVLDAELLRLRQRLEQVALRNAGARDSIVRLRARRDALLEKVRVRDAALADLQRRFEEFLMRAEAADAATHRAYGRVIRQLLETAQVEAEVRGKVGVLLDHIEQFGKDGATA